MDLLLIFVKNPRLGKVKTRLAATVGDRQALRIYLKLLERTRAITQPLSVVKTVYYTPEILTDDLWDSAHYQKAQQREGDLGERMHEAFRQGFAQGYQRICIIGSDCYELSTTIIKQAFDQLATHDVVIGPSTDGGYYLLGMNRLYSPLFTYKAWSTSTVKEDTLRDVTALHLRHFTLPTLTDVDDEDDLISMR
ncbi:MAG: TIGR04282 family arsenosugar biosynthesis glycosyltransferase [Tunicatimonas sp.]